MDISCGVPEAPSLKESSVCCGPAEGFHTKNVKTEGKQVPKHACFFPFLKKTSSILGRGEAELVALFAFPEGWHPSWPHGGLPWPFSLLEEPNIWL